MIHSMPCYTSPAPSCTGTMFEDTIARGENLRHRFKRFSWLAFVAAGLWLEVTKKTNSGQGQWKGCSAILWSCTAGATVWLKSCKWRVTTPIAYDRR